MFEDGKSEHRATLRRAGQNIMSRRAGNASGMYVPPHHCPHGQDLPGRQLRVHLLAESLARHAITILVEIAKAAHLSARWARVIDVDDLGVAEFSVETSRSSMVAAGSRLLGVRDQNSP